jgi:hypothetical protein
MIGVDARKKFPLQFRHILYGNQDSITRCGVYSASYPMGTAGSLPGGKADGAWSWTLDPSTPSSRIRGALPAFPHMTSWRGASLIKHTENFTGFLPFYYYRTLGRWHMAKQLFHCADNGKRGRDKLNWWNAGSAMGGMKRYPTNIRYLSAESNNN